MPTKELEKFFKDCDYLVFDSTFLDKEKQKALDTYSFNCKTSSNISKKCKCKESNFNTLFSKIQR